MTESPSSKKTKARPPILRALGLQEPPEELTVLGRAYRRTVIFKHDSWAATCRYDAVEPTGEDDVIAVKTNRRQPVLIVPMIWLGWILAKREAAIYQRMADVEGVPKFLGRLDATTVAHTFIPGEPLAPGDQLTDEFLNDLQRLVETFHKRDIAVVDLQKCENVLVGEDGKPYLMDFQISWALPENFVGKFPPLRWIHGIFVSSDKYHLRKHFYRFRPDLLSEEEKRRIERKPLVIRIHRAVTRYPQKLRRQLLVWLKIREPGGKATSEIAPERGVERRNENNQG